MSHNSSRKHIVLLSTGGTIASRYDKNTGRTQIVSSGEELIETVPGIGQLANVTVDTVFTVPSFCLQPSHVMQLKSRVEDYLSKDNTDGIVITHGTDTMEETAFLMYLLLDNSKPVVFTGAQLSSDMEGADGPRNLLNAIRIASNLNAAKFGPLIAFCDGIYNALDVTKLHTSNLNAFGSRRHSPIGETTRDEVIFFNSTKKRYIYETQELVENIDLVRLYLGISSEPIEYCVQKGTRGLVIQSFGIGNATPEIVDCVEKLTGKGIPVVITSRCSYGRVTPVYGSGGGRDLQDAGAIFAGDLSGEKARLALMVLLGIGYDQERIKKELEKLVN